MSRLSNLLAELCAKIGRRDGFGKFLTGDELKKSLFDSQNNHQGGNGTPATRASKQWVHRIPAVVIGVVAAMVLVSVLLTIGPKPQTYYVGFLGALIPFRYTAALNTGEGSYLLYLMPITYQFLHGGFMHLLFNSMFLIVFGSPVALRWSARSGLVQGGVLFVLFFLAAGIFSALVYVIVHYGSHVPVIGASASVSALMAAAIRGAFRPTAVTGEGRGDYIMPVTHPLVMRFTIIFIVLNVMVGLFGNAMTPNGAQVAWDAHIAGYLIGLFMFPVFDHFNTKLAYK